MLWVDSRAGTNMHDMFPDMGGNCHRRDAVGHQHSRLQHVVWRECWWPTASVSSHVYDRRHVWHHACRRECWWPTASVSSTMMTWLSQQEETDAVGHQHSRLQHVTWLTRSAGHQHSPTTWWHDCHCRKLIVTSTRVYNMMTWLSWHGRKLMLCHHVVDASAGGSQHQFSMKTWLSWHGRKLMLWVTSIASIMITWL